MTVARSVGDVLSEHVQFEIECIDRMYCDVYVPMSTCRGCRMPVACWATCTVSALSAALDPVDGEVH